MCAHACVCCCCYHHLPPSPPVSGLINKTVSAAPFGSPARVAIILWSNINVWYWACSLIQSQLILSVNYLQILRCGGRSLRTKSSRFSIWNWLPFCTPIHAGLSPLSLLLPHLLSFSLSSHLLPFWFVCLLKPKWMSFQRLRVCCLGCCLGISISIADVCDVVGRLCSGRALCLLQPVREYTY